MTLQTFLANFDHDQSFVLLEGKRTVLPEDQEKLIALGRLLASKTSKIIFRSGNAEGSDQFFSMGVASVDSKRLQVITPYSGHRQKTNLAYQTISLDEINLSEEPELVYLSRQNKKTEKLVDQYVAGDKNRYSVKAAYILRDTVKVIGAGNVSPASFGIFYDDLAEPMSGGTGHTMKVCVQHGISMVNQTVWFKWLEE